MPAARGGTECFRQERCRHVSPHEERNEDEGADERKGVLGGERRWRIGLDSDGLAILLGSFFKVPGNVEGRQVADGRDHERAGWRIRRSHQRSAPRRSRPHPSRAVAAAWIREFGDVE